MTEEFVYFLPQDFSKLVIHFKCDWVLLMLSYTDGELPIFLSEVYTQGNPQQQSFY
jgi:hypothetical protein